MHHNFIGSFEDLMDSEVTEESLDGVILEITVTTVELKRIIDNVKALISGELLGHGAVHGVVWVLVSHAHSSVSYHKTRSLKINSHLCKLELHMLIGSQWLSKLLSLLDVSGGEIQAFSGTSEGATGNVKSSTVKAGKCNLKTLSSLSNHVFLWYSHLIHINQSRWMSVPSHLIFIA